MKEGRKDSHDKDWSKTRQERRKKRTEKVGQFDNRWVVQLIPNIQVNMLRVYEKNIPFKVQRMTE